jgi:hypothetical protein
MGPQMRMERDRTTRSGARAPGVERQQPLERRCFSAQRPSAQNGDPTRAAGSTKGGGKPSDVQAASNGQALSDTPALKPYWGKPAVRNFREGNGNVGIIRSPLRAIALPDQSSAQAQSDAVLHSCKRCFSSSLAKSCKRRFNSFDSPCTSISTCVLHSKAIYSASEAF